MPPSLFPILKLLMNHQLLPALRANALYEPFYRLSFMAGAAKCGLLADLAQGPLSFDEIAANHGQPGAKFREAIEAWLHLGVRLGLLATCCQGGNVGMEVLNLWGAATKSGGRLPGVGEMREQLKAAGHASVDAISLIPADRFFAFRAGY